MILFLLKLILLPLLAPLCVGIVRKTKALMQNRKGASIIQPYYDLWKLSHKNEVISRDASWLFLVTPFILFAISILVISAVPLFGRAEMALPFGDFLTIIFLLATGTFFLALAGIDVGSAFGGFGSSREMTLASLAEALLVFTLLPVAFLTNSTNLGMMVMFTANLSLVSYFVLVFSFFGYVIALFAETGRIPFDNAATHLELTMIHEAMILEYSGKRLALIEWANAIKLFFFVLLGVNVFFPFGMTAQSDIISLLSAFIFSLGKAFIFLVIIAVVESTIAKYRFFRLPDILLTGFIFGVIAIVSISIL